MTTLLDAAAHQADLSHVTELMGGPRVLRTQPATSLDVHQLLKDGLPQQALDYLVDHVGIVKGGRHFEDAFGMTYRTYQRRNDPGTQPLTPEQSGRTWTFARVLAKATEVFGSQDEAETWISEPAMGLSQQTPLDLLQTPAGVELVTAFFTRIEHGVYT